MQVAVRTLQRRLNEQGLTYSDLVEKLRYREACRMLKRTEKPVAAIAAALDTRTRAISVVRFAAGPACARVSTA